jgi:hypothetical protein
MTERRRGIIWLQLDCLRFWQLQTYFLMLWSKPRADNEEYGLINDKSLHPSRRRAKTSKHYFRKRRQIAHLRRQFTLIPFVLVVGVALTWTASLVWNSNILGRGERKGAGNFTGSASNLFHEWKAFWHPETATTTNLTEEHIQIGVPEQVEHDANLQQKESDVDFRELNVPDSQQASNQFQDIGRHSSANMSSIEIKPDNQSSATAEFQNADMDETRRQEVLKEVPLCELDILDPEEGGEDPILLIPGRDTELSNADRKFIQRERSRSQHPSSRILNRQE